MGGICMASKKRARGSIYKHRGKLALAFYWLNPNGASEPHRWAVTTQKEDNQANRQELEARLNDINVKIDANVFYPCKEFPKHKIAAFCRCPNCLVAVPLANAHHAPLTLGELKAQYMAHELARSTGDKKEIESSSYYNKQKLWNVLESGFQFVDQLDGGVYQYDPLTDYEIGELTPEAVQDWLRSFQARELPSGKKPNRTKYLINLKSEIELALKFGQFKRYWSKHALLDYTGTLLKSTKEELSERKNKSIEKPFSVEQMNAIISWFRQRWLDTPETKYNGKEKLRLFFLYHYVVIDFNTGLRSPSELTALEWSDIDYGKREIHVRKSRESSGALSEQVVRQYTKTIKHRIVPLNDMALASFRALEQYRQPDADWIFWNPRADKNNPFLAANGWAALTGHKRINYPFSQCLKALKIQREENGQYAMRHTFATLMLDNTNFSDSKVAALIGDSVDTMKRHYAGFCQKRWRDEDDLNQMNNINQTATKRHLKAVE